MRRLFGRAVHNSALCCLHNGLESSLNNCIWLMNKTYIYSPQFCRFCGPRYLPFSSCVLLNVKLCVKCNISYSMRDNFKLNADNLSPFCPRATNLIRDCYAGINREVKYPFREISLKKIKSTSGKKKIKYRSLLFSIDFKRSLGWLGKLHMPTCRHGMLAEVISLLSFKN